MAPCNHTCFARDGKWCNECWRKILGGGFEYLPMKEQLLEFLEETEDEKAD